MWNAQSSPEFVLTGKFKELILDAMACGLDDFHPRALDEEFLVDLFEDTGFSDIDEAVFPMFAWHEPFESLCPRDKIYLLSTVLKALLEPDVPAPPLTQYNESAVFAIFEIIEHLVEMEIDAQAEGLLPADGEDLYEFRRLVAIVEKENILCMDEDEYEYIDYTNAELDAWHLVTESLTEIILWDLDFLEAGSIGTAIADAPPEDAAERKRILGISDEYYATPLEQITREQFQDAVDYLLKTLWSDNE